MTSVAFSNKLVLTVPLSPFSVVVDPVHNVILLHLRLLSDDSLRSSRDPLQRGLQRHLN
jgi:hypothetical protein